jgi:hypothetical protein
LSISSIANEWDWKERGLAARLKLCGEKRKFQGSSNRPVRKDCSGKRKERFSPGGSSGCYTHEMRAEQESEGEKRPEKRGREGKKETVRGFGYR